MMITQNSMPDWYNYRRVNPVGSGLKATRNNQIGAWCCLVYVIDVYCLWSSAAIEVNSQTYNIGT